MVDVPYFRPQISEREIDEVVAVLRSGWLTTGPRVRLFEEAFAEAVGARHAVALASCTAALHLALEALGVGRGDLVLVPTMTFAATAEVVRYFDAVPILVDCDDVMLHVDLQDAEEKLGFAVAGDLPVRVPTGSRTVGLIPVHVGGLMMDPHAVQEVAATHNLWVVEDAAHSFPAAWRADGTSPWIQCGGGSSAAACFSFYANKTMTTGEGGMLVTDSDDLADRARVMALHGLSRDAWERYSGSGSWDYRIIAPGFKYNMTDIAAAIGLGQLERAQEMRDKREEIALEYLRQFEDLMEIELPPTSPNRVHAWHLFPIRLRLERLQVDRNRFFEILRENGVGCSVHWRPLHLHNYYRDLGWKPEDCPTASKVWERLLSLPLFPDMTSAEMAHVIETVRTVCRNNRR